MERDAAREQLADDGDHVVFLERAAQPAMAHAPSGAIGHLPVLQMVAGAREQVVIAAMVVVHVRQDHVVTASGSTPTAFSPMAGERRNCRPRFAPIGASKPVSKMKLPLSPPGGPLMAQTK